MSEFVHVSGRKFEVISSGSRPPSVVFESGAGRGADDWIPVLELIDPGVSTFAYSRAGQGKSDAPATEDVIGTNSGAQVASAASRTRDLVALLNHVGIEPPHILVGHSLGGHYIRLFTSQNPQSVAGLVFVDCSHPNQVERLSDAVRASSLPRELKEKYLSEPSGLTQIHHAAVGTGPFDPIPVAVFSRDPGVGFGVDAEELDAVLMMTWSEMQAELAELSTNSSHVTVDGADHLVHHAAPQLITAEIMRMVEVARSGEPGSLNST